MAWARQFDRELDGQRAQGHPQALVRVPVGVRVGEGAELVQARRLLGAGCISVRATLAGCGYLLAARPEEGCGG